jgi:SH3 domain protein
MTKRSSRPNTTLPLLAMLGLGAVLSTNAFADFRQTIAPATIGYEGPSTRAEKQFLYSRGTPLEVVVAIEGWYKVRDVQGALVWVERKAMAERTQVIVGAQPASIHASADAISPVLFIAEPGVILQLVAPPDATTGLYAQVRHRDGVTGFVRVDAVFGL